MTGSAPLTGLRVLDLTLGPAGGIATMVLADFGAEVLKVEPPSGDPFRSQAAAPMWLRGKQSIVLDLSKRRVKIECARHETLPPKQLQQAPRT